MPCKKGGWTLYYSKRVSYPIAHIPMSHDASPSDPDYDYAAAHAHAQRGAPPRIPTISRVQPGLFLGRLEARHLVEELDITLVINCTSGLDRVTYGLRRLDDVAGVLEVSIDMEDREDADLRGALDCALPYLDAALVAGQQTLCHCVYGVSRSASLLVGYFIKRQGMNYDEALSCVEAARNCVNPNVGFVKVLKALAEEEEGKRQRQKEGPPKVPMT